ncbi:hypothetical protein ACOMHN_033665 [Nucella lapillus]
MPKYYCDYCDTFLTHDSPSVRKTHCNGRKHKENVRMYYQKWLEEQVQKLVDDTTAAYKAGKITTNPFQGGGVPGVGAMVPPPANLGGPTPTPPVRPPMMGGPAVPMGGPGPRPMGPMGPGPGPMMPGLRPGMGPPMGPPMMLPMGMRHPAMGGPPGPR